MQYMGGKSRYGKKIAAHINDRIGGRLYVEPFCGALNVARHVDADRMVLNDMAPCLTQLFEEVAAGKFEFPSSVSREEYDALKTQARAGQHTTMSTFVGFGLSFGGKFFGGYAKNQAKRDYLACAINLLSKKMEDLSARDVQWSNLPYDALVFDEPSLIYCDPPYAGTTNYEANAGAFDSNAFWDWCRERSAEGHILLISEYIAPEDFEIVEEWEHVACVSKNFKTGNHRAPKTIERLFTLPHGGNP